MSDVHGPVILCGLEGLSVRTLEELDRLGEPVVLIAGPGGDPRRRELAVSLAERLVEGDPRDAAVLRAAGIATARALVLTDDDDVANIHIALAAVAEQPGLHVVIRTFDEAFGRRVEALIPCAVALSASAIAAPGFVSAILGAGDTRHLAVAGHTLALAAADAADARTVLTLVDDRRVPALVLPDAAAVAGATLPSLVEVVGTDADPGIRRSGRGRRAGPGAMLRRVDRRFWVLGAVLAAITVGAALVFEAARGLSLIDAVSTTVGGFFGAVNADVASTPELKLFGIALTLTGAAALALFYGLIADVVLSARMRDLLGPRPTEARDHVIVVGLGTIGFRIARSLQEDGVAVVAAERSAEGRFVEEARDLGIPVVIGDAANPALLRTLGVDRARALAVVTDSDAANLATALHGRGVREDLRIVVRLFDPDLAAQLGQALGAYHTRSVSTLAAPAFAAAAVDREVIATIPVGERRVVVVARIPVTAGSAADGSTVGAEEAAASSVADGGARVLAVVSAAVVDWRPSATRRVSAGDEVVLIAPRRSLAVALARTGPVDAGGS